MESYKNNIDKSKNKLFKDNEFISQTKKEGDFFLIKNYLLINWKKNIKVALKVLNHLNNYL